MENELIKKIRAELGTNNDLIGIPATHENLLNVKFNDQYLEFITLFGGAFGGINIHAFNNGSLIGKATVVDLALKFRQAQGRNLNSALKNLYVISDDGSGNPILMNAQGNIFVFLHDSGDMEILSNSLEDLLSKSFPC